jgi:hypothetical protein
MVRLQDYQNKKFSFFYALIFILIIFIAFTINEQIKNKSLSEFEKLNQPLFDIPIILMSIIFGLIVYFIIKKMFRLTKQSSFNKNI